MSPDPRGVGGPGERGLEPAFTLRLVPLCWSLGAGKKRCGRSPGENGASLEYDFGFT